jgi:hypothetical protein
MAFTAALAEAPDMGTIAVLLADPLRQAWLDHLTPFRPCCQAHGIAHCLEAMRLFHLLPEGDQWTILSQVS